MILQKYFDENPDDASIIGVAINIDAVLGVTRKSKVMNETTDEVTREQYFEPLDSAPPESVITRWFGPCG